METRLQLDWDLYEDVLAIIIKSLPQERDFGVTFEELVQIIINSVNSERREDISESLLGNIFESLTIGIDHERAEYLLGMTVKRGSSKILHPMYFLRQRSILKK